MKPQNRTPKLITTCLVSAVITSIALAPAYAQVRTARRHVLHIDQTWPWAETITTAHGRLCALPVP